MPGTGAGPAPPRRGCFYAKYCGTSCIGGFLVTIPCPMGEETPCVVYCNLFLGLIPIPLGCACPSDDPNVSPERLGWNIALTADGSGETYIGFTETGVNVHTVYKACHAELCTTRNYQEQCC